MSQEDLTRTEGWALLAVPIWPVSAPHECGPWPAGEAGPGRAGRAGQGGRVDRVAVILGRGGQSPAPLSPQALGCILYLLCFGQHPFEDGALQHCQREVRQSLLMTRATCVPRLPDP